MTPTPITAADLRPVDLFDDIDDDELAQWAAVSRELTFEPNEWVATQDKLAPMRLLLEGTVQMMMLRNGRPPEVTSQQHAPTWMGAIAALTGRPMDVSVRAQTHCRFAIIDPEDFRRLALAQPPVHHRVMAQVVPVMSRLTAIEQDRERLTSLGTMAAGLAHELNNPAAAARRAAEQMAEALEVLSSTLGRFVEAGIERSTAHKLYEMQRDALATAGDRTALDALDAADAEDDLSERLGELGVSEPWKLAEPLAAAGLDEAWASHVAEVAGPATDAAIAWVAASLTARGLAGELQEATQRMSALVDAVKSYSYMDRGELVEVDVHEGLETTLAVLGHKLKHTSIKVVRDYDRDLPKLSVRGSELNQVWTNLLDNAIAAIGESGTITITTQRDGPCALIDIADDGPGIPEEIRGRVFDAFYTTKDVGQGTGLGLATARRIVVDRHAGSLTLDSGPDGTTFHVWIPLTHAQ